MGITTWDEYRKTINITEEDEAQIRLESELIDAFIAARESKGMTQRQLAEVSGIKQPVIARMEKAVNSPQISTLLRTLAPLGYTLSIVPQTDQAQTAIH